MIHKTLRSIICNLKRLSCLTILLVAPICANAADPNLTPELLRLYEWNPGNTLAPLILPVRAAETPENAAQRYLHELSKNTDLLELFLGRSPDLPLQGFKPLASTDREHRALMIANLPKDLTLNSERVQNFKTIFAQAKHQSYILPLAADLGLSRGEAKDLQQQIALKFPLLVAIGGEDVTPAAYGAEDFHARNTVPRRDQFELELIKSYVKYEKGFLLGVCRGSQISAVALGYKLIQDLPFHKGTHIEHGNNWHPIEILNTKNNLLKSIAGEQRHLTVNSLHHQSVIYRPGGPLEVAARSHDGTVEATELKNGRGLLLQYHPELMGNALGTQIIHSVLRYKNTVMPRMCSQIL